MENPRKSRCTFEALEDRRLLSASLVMASASNAPVPGEIALTGVMPVGVTIHSEATDRFSGTVGILKNFRPPPIVAAMGPASVGLQEIVNWGDGTTSSAGSLVRSPAANEFFVKGSHTYAK